MSLDHEGWPEHARSVAGSPILCRIQPDSDSVTAPTHPNRELAYVTCVP
jgi:hypothetical protein